MCILSKLGYAKFAVSNLFFSKVIEGKPLGVEPLVEPSEKGIFSRIRVTLIL